MLEALIGVLSFVAGTMIIMGLGISIKPPQSGYGNKKLKK